MSRKHHQKLPMMALFVLSLLPSTIQLEDPLKHRQHTNFCIQHVCNLLVLVVLFSGDSSGSFELWKFLILRILLRFPFRHLHESLPLVRCHHQWVLHLDSELLLDLHAHCSAILVSQLLILLLKTLLGIVHTLDFVRLHFSVQVEIGSIILKTNWNKPK